MLPQEVIRRKRDGEELSREEIAFMIAGLSNGATSDAQAASFAMAILLRGMTDSEVVALTLAMRDSGPTLEWPPSDFSGPIVDKHSTGGIGDNVSLLLAPLLAAVGAFVPMISGRGLGHTGGTLDKLDSIPGYVSQPGIALFRKTVKEVGCAIIGQTPDLVPADRRLYAIRDVTGTVESIPLIVASILSKKLAAGLGTLVLDVKAGSGAFMASLDEARRLATGLVSVARGAKLRVSALVTDMDEPLASVAGNALEVRHAIDNLKERSDTRTAKVTLALAEEILVLSDLAATRTEASSRLRKAWDGGEAAAKLARMIAALGGPNDMLEKPDRHLAPAPIIRPILPAASGTVTRIDTRSIGIAVIVLGGGRRLPSDAIDHAVGLTSLAGKGASVGPGAPLAILHARSEASASEAEHIVKAAYHLGEKPQARALVLDRVGVD